MLAVNATSLTGHAITQMGMWTITGPGTAARQWIMPTPNWLLPTVIYPDPGAISPSMIAWGYTDDTTDALDAVIGPGYQPCR